MKGAVLTEGQVRYPPYTPAKFKQFLRTSRMPAINFDRNGKLRYGGLLWRFVLLGAASPTPGVLRLLLVIISECFAWRGMTIARC